MTYETIILSLIWLCNAFLAGMLVQSWLTRPRLSEELHSNQKVA